MKIDKRLAAALICVCALILATLIRMNAKDDSGARLERDDWNVEVKQAVFVK